MKKKIRKGPPKKAETPLERQIKHSVIRAASQMVQQGKKRIEIADDDFEAVITTEHKMSVGEWMEFPALCIECTAIVTVPYSDESAEIMLSVLPCDLVDLTNVDVTSN